MQPSCQLALPENLNRLIEYLESDPKVVLAFLFGSQAKRKERPDSDADIAVYLNEPFSRQDINSLWSALEDIVHKDVDLIVLNDAPSDISWTAFKGKSSW